MSTFLSLHYHIIFSTKYRKPWIGDAWIDRFHDYIGGTIRGLDGVPESVGGVNDHVHLLVGLKSTHRLCDFMRELKKSTSEWVHETIKEPRFNWQEGYAGFTVSPTSRAGVKTYIGRQAEHHRKQTFQEELIELLQNISNHGARDGKGHMHAYLIVAKIENEYQLFTGNLVLSEAVTPMRERITQLLELDITA
jgi:REP element-mobilizing transposase RayT